MICYKSLPALTSVHKTPLFCVFMYPLNSFTSIDGQRNQNSLLMILCSPSWTCSIVWLVTDT